jgi:hypothetical protein
VEVQESVFSPEIPELQAQCERACIPRTQDLPLARHQSHRQQAASLHSGSLHITDTQPTYHNILADTVQLIPTINTRYMLVAAAVTAADLNSILNQRFQLRFFNAYANARVMGILYCNITLCSNATAAQYQISCLQQEAACLT